jgi:N-methylhydantoinase A/oxoprolinase/acetone carboxylase beta subunit
MILGIDVGGTHTDAVLIDHFRVVKKAKVLTNPENLLTSLLEVTTELVDAATIDQLERVVLIRIRNQGDQNLSSSAMMTALTA